MTQQEYNNGTDLWADDMYRFALHCGADAETARDAVQEAFASLWEHRSEVKQPCGKSFLYTIVQRKVASHFRRLKMEQGTADNQAVEPSIAPCEDFDLRDAMATALARLPETQRAALQLKEVDGYSVREIAAILAANEQQVLTWLFRARVSMRKHLTALGYDNNK